jgi:hypothetical protein
VRDSILLFTRNPAILGGALVINKSLVAGRRIVANVCLITVVTWIGVNAINRVVYAPIGGSRVTMARDPNVDGEVIISSMCCWVLEWLEKGWKRGRAGGGVCRLVFDINMRGPRSRKHSCQSIVDVRLVGYKSQVLCAGDWIQ